MDLRKKNGIELMIFSRTEQDAAELPGHMRMDYAVEVFDTVIEAQDECAEILSVLEANMGCDLSYDERHSLDELRGMQLTLDCLLRQVVCLAAPKMVDELIRDVQNHPTP